MLSRILFIFVCVGLLISCSKQKAPQNTTPHSYFPAYPSSHWEYVYHLGQTVIKQVDPNLHVFEYLDDCYVGYGAPGPDYEPTVIDQYAVPKYEGKYVFGHILDGNSVCRDRAYLMFPEDIDGASLGRFYSVTYSDYGPTGYVYRELTFKDSIVEVQGNLYGSTIGIRERKLFNGLTQDETYEYYTKNVGLIYRVHIDYDIAGGQHDTTTLELVSHNIND